VLFIVVVYVASWVVTQTQVLVTTSKHAITAANSVCLFLFLSWKCFTFTVLTEEGQAQIFNNV
jgi:hypothetical protein